MQENDQTDFGSESNSASLLHHVLLYSSWVAFLCEPNVLFILIIITYVFARLFSFRFDYLFVCIFFLFLSVHFISDLFQVLIFNFCFSLKFDDSPLAFFFVWFCLFSFLVSFSWKTLAIFLNEVYKYPFRKINWGWTLTWCVYEYDMCMNVVTTTVITTIVQIEYVSMSV